MTESKKTPGRNKPIPELDPVMHQPIRTRMVAYLAARDEVTFNELKGAIQITDGNLDAHMKKLLAFGYVEARRESGNGRPQTFYMLTEAGRIACRVYVDALQALLRGL
jgi:predicted ArsR family transcriptional regulator